MQNIEQERLNYMKSQEIFDFVENILLNAKFRYFGLIITKKTSDTKKGFTAVLSDNNVLYLFYFFIFLIQSLHKWNKDSLVPIIWWQYCQISLFLNN